MTCTKINYYHSGYMAERSTQDKMIRHNPAGLRPTSFILCFQLQRSNLTSLGETRPLEKQKTEDGEPFLQGFSRRAALYQGGISPSIHNPRPEEEFNETVNTYLRTVFGNDPPLNRLARISASATLTREEITLICSLHSRFLEYQQTVWHGRTFSTKLSSVPTSTKDLNSWRPS